MESAGFALRCDSQGIVREIVRDGLGLDVAVGPGVPFTRVVDRQSFEKALSFLVDLRACGAAFQWEMNVALEGRLTALHFAGAKLGEELLIVGARTAGEIMETYENLARLNSQQATALRAMVKAHGEGSHVRAERDSELFDEISRLTNELVTLQRELAGKNVELQRLNEEKNRFLGMAAHDLRAPLGVLQGYSEFLRDELGPVLSEDHRELLAHIHGSSRFMLGLVNNLLDVAAIESGSFQLDLASTDLTALTRRVVALNGVLASRKGIPLTLQVEGEIPALLLDSHKIEQVLNNLIGNAIKFSSPGSPVQVHLARRADRLLVSVVDQGPGIPEAEHAKLFTPFGKTSVRGTAGEKSTGLGLAITRRIVGAHHGEVWVETGEGRGSAFRVSLPLGWVEGVSR